MNPTDAETPSLSVGFISLGCAKNLVDSQVIAGVLVSENLSLARSPDEADILLVNTCAFIEDARQESLAAIRDACRLKNEGACRAVIVAGCLPQRYRKELEQQLPEVDAFLGLDELEKVGEIVRRVAQGETHIVEVPEKAVKLYEPRRPGIVFTGGPFAFLKIAEGCLHGCAFCAIPRIRGAYRSRPMASLVAEAQALLGAGFRELNLVAQDVTAYGRDLKDGTDLPALLSELGRLKGRFWIRLLYGHPEGITDSLLRVMADLPAVCRYLDVPVQHSHPEMLEAMGRGRTAEPVRRLGERIRSVLPDAVLRTTCLVGFPGETEEHFRHLLDYVRLTEFDHLGVFVYSPEENTRAFHRPGRPDPAVAEDRRRRLLLEQRAVVDRKAAGLIGTTAEVLLERKDPDDDTVWIGRSRRHAPDVDGVVRVSDVPAKARPGDFVRARYTAQEEYDLKAVAVG